MSFVAAPAGAQSLKVQVDPGGRLAALALDRGLTVLAAAKTDVEDFTTPKTTAKKELPPQRLTFQKPQAAKGEGEAGK